MAFLAYHQNDEVVLNSIIINSSVVHSLNREVKGGHVTRWTNLFFPLAVLLYAIYIIASTLLIGIESKKLK